MYANTYPWWLSLSHYEGLYLSLVAPFIVLWIRSYRDTVNGVVEAFMVDKAWIGLMWQNMQLPTNLPLNVLSQWIARNPLQYRKNSNKKCNVKINFNNVPFICLCNILKIMWCRGLIFYFVIYCFNITFNIFKLPDACMWFSICIISYTYTYTHIIWEYAYTILTMVC